MENASSCTLVKFTRSDYQFLTFTPTSFRRSRLLVTTAFPSMSTGLCLRASPVFTAKRVSLTYNLSSTLRRRLASISLLDRDLTSMLKYLVEVSPDGFRGLTAH
jgi:hypothetical protein